MRALLLVALVGCHPKVDDAPHEGFWAAFDPAEASLELGRDEDMLLRVPRDGFQLGEAPLDDTKSYDPFWNDSSAVYRRLESAEESDDGWTLRFDGGATATLTLGHRAEGRFEVVLAPDDPVAYVRLEAEVSAEEGFYGLGGVLDTPNHRGKTRAMQLEIDPRTESVNNEAHVPIPLLIGTNGWGWFVQDDRPMSWDVATEADDEVRVTVGTGAVAEDPVVFHLYAAEHPLDITRKYYDTTGDPLLPARWGLGPLVWRDENDDQTQVEADLDAMRDLDLAASGIWIDRPYATGVQTFDFDARFPDPDAMIGKAHDLGFRMALWHVPYVDPAEAPAVRAEADAGGFFPPKHPPVFNNWSEPVDLTHPDAYAWWRDWIRAYTDRGIEGFKLDYAEDIVLGANGARLAWEFHDGSDERTMHARYTRLYHEVYAETLPEEGGFLLCRAGAWGDQRRTSVIWPGDLDATMDPWGTDRGDYVAVGGLPASVVYALSLGPSGYPFFGSDTGGYRHSPPDKETFTRWFEQTALSTVMQIGTSSNDVAWEPTDENGFDAEMLDWYRDYVRLHQRLFPYLWSYAERLEADGRPLMRPLGLAYPELGVHPGDTYLLGDELLVAPVVVRGDRQRELDVPPGRWIDWFTGEVLEEGEATVDAPLEKLPLYLREGGIVPLLRPTIDTMSPTTEPDRVDSYATTAGVLWVRIWPGPANEFAVFDGATITADGASVRITEGSEFAWGAMIELIGTAAPGEVRLDAAVLPRQPDLATVEAAGGWTWSSEVGGTVIIGVPPGNHTVDWDG